MWRWTTNFIVQTAQSSLDTPCAILLFLHFSFQFLFTCVVMMKIKKREEEEEQKRQENGMRKRIDDFLYI